MTNRYEAPSVVLAALLAAAVAVFGGRAGTDGAPDPPRPILLDPNRAPERLLVFLPRIGRVRARAIVDERRRGGPFADLDDLRRVHGIGPATIQQMRTAVATGGDP